MIQSIGAAGVTVTAILLWAVGILYGVMAVTRGIRRHFEAGYGWSRDWFAAVFAFFMLLVWLLVGFLVMVQVKFQ